MQFNNKTDYIKQAVLELNRDDNFHLTLKKVIETPVTACDFNYWRILNGQPKYVTDNTKVILPEEIFTRDAKYKDRYINSDNFKQFSDNNSISTDYIITIKVRRWLKNFFDINLAPWIGRIPRNEYWSIEDYFKKAVELINKNKHKNLWLADFELV